MAADNEDSIKRPLKQLQAEAEADSSKASELARNLGLAAIAAIWIFKNPEGNDKLLPPLLTTALILAVLGLGLDLIHYIFSSWALTSLHDKIEAQYDANPNAPGAKEMIADVHTPGWIRQTNWLFSIGKQAAIILSYILIMVFLSQKL